jgi:hypothetical protein
MQYHNENYRKYVTGLATERFAPLRRPRNFIPPSWSALFLLVLSGSVFSFVAFAISITLKH